MMPNRPTILAAVLLGTASLAVGAAGVGIHETAPALEPLTPVGTPGPLVAPDIRHRIPADHWGVDHFERRPDTPDTQPEPPGPPTLKPVTRWPFIVVMSVEIDRRETPAYFLY